jgi:HK97 gp10 family phage protein
MSAMIKVDGLKQLGERMQKLGADVNKRTSRAATAAGARVVRDATRKNIDALQLVDTGNMRAAVAAQRSKRTRLTSEHRVGIKSGGGYRSGDIQGGKTSDVKAAKTGTGKLGVDAFYWRFLEFGTVDRPATPFLRPAFESNKNKAVEEIKRVLERRIKKAEGGQ